MINFVFLWEIIIVFGFGINLIQAIYLIFFLSIYEINNIQIKVAIHKPRIRFIFHELFNPICFIPFKIKSEPEKKKNKKKKVSVFWDYKINGRYTQSLMSDFFGKVLLRKVYVILKNNITSFPLKYTFYDNLYKQKVHNLFLNLYFI